MGRILIVEDEEHSVRALENFLEDAGHSIVSAAQAREAIARAPELEPQVLLTDLFLADREGGAAVARILTDRDPSLKVIVMTGLPETEAERQMEGIPVFEVCLKPLRLTAVAAAVEAALSAEPEGAEGGASTE